MISPASLIAAVAGEIHKQAKSIPVIVLVLKKYDMIYLARNIYVNSAELP
ncbi:MAG: hypothetical protein OFPII_34790 [Osedax symbiont Rs1]|nr:MAG: hypothetical protein OFPII_34790 [Osedax symbiont Rs1]